MTKKNNKITQNESPHHCSIIKSNTRLTFRSESRLKSDSTKGAAGGVSGRRPDVRVSSQSAASNSDGTFRLRDFPLCDRGEVQIGGGGGRGAGTTWLGFMTAGDGGSSSKREEQSGEDVKLSSLAGCCKDCEGSAPEGGGGDEDEESERDSAGGQSSAPWGEPKRQVTKRKRRNV